ncbi:MAG: ATP-dependent helicase HrpB [Verrucomicrobiota bacterium]|nr:ATP-dependent helicase HrpB [Verrucomicrobiota bacterium]
MERTLPIWQIHGEILRALASGNRAVLIAPTGSGKTTQVPQICLDHGLAGSGKIVVLQPRRVAARTVAARVAQERGVTLGQEVGYQVRFEDETSLGTRICFVTEGILLRWLHDSPTLKDVAVILFDEFHERNLLSDVALGLVKRIQEQSRPDLKLLVMSATLEAEPIAKYLGGAPVLVSEGRMFPVEIQFQEHHDERPLTEQAADAVEKILRAGDEGDILVFMPGMGEINATINACKTIRSNERITLIPLHGELPPEQQDIAFLPHPHRKIIVSTNVAETSVTIDGIRHVVDSGVARISRFDHERGIGTLFLEEISRASADQRAGRAGRTAPGSCQRLWTESNHLNRPARNTPEIQRADLAEAVLLLHSLGIKSAIDFEWIDSPDAQSIRRAEELLRNLGALTHEGEITPVGRQMLKLPMHPRYSRMLVEAVKHRCVRAAALCAALVSGRDLLMRLGRDEKHISEARELFEGSAESDFYTLMRAFEFARKNNFALESCRRYGIHAQSARQVEQTFAQILEICKRHKLIAEEGEAIAPDALPRSIMTGFVDQLCVRRDKGSLECALAGNRSGTLMRESVVQHAELFVASSIREVQGRTGAMTLLGLATAIKLEWLRELFPQHLSSSVEHLYDRGHKRVAAVRLLRFQDLVLGIEHQPEVEPKASGKALAEAHLRGWFELPLLNHEIKQFINRNRLLALNYPDLGWPRFDKNEMLLVLTEAFRGLHLAKEAQGAELKPAFMEQLDPAHRGWLDELAPLTIPWLEGKKVKLSYPDPAEEEEEIVPELQVKLHEILQLQEHPAICEGKVPLRLWLASPEGKRLASTRDWPKFRQIEYPKLKPELKRKYPGFTWL